MRRWLAGMVGVLLALSSLSVDAAFFDRREGSFQDVIADVSYRLDGAASDRFEQVFADADRWLLQKNVPFPQTKDPLNVWAKFDLPAVTAVKHVLMTTSAWERVQYYVVRDGQLVDRQVQGTGVPLKERTTHISMTPTFAHAGFVSVDLLPQSRTTIYARLQTSQNYAPIIRLRFQLWNADQVLEGERRDRMITGVYLGVMLVLIIYNLGLYAVIRESSYFYYVVMELGGVFFWCTYYGMTSEALWPSRPTWDYFSLWISLAASLAGCMQFVRHYLDTAKHFPRANVMLNRMSYLSVLVMVPPFFPLGTTLANYGVNIVVVVGTLSMCLGFGVIVLALRHHHPLAKHFFAAALASFLAFFVTLAQSTGMIAATDFTVHASQLGSAITGIMLSMGLGFRLRQTRKALAEQQVVEAQTQSRHERERRELMEQHNQELEAKVVERTAELIASQRQTDVLLANILPRAIIDELKARGASEPRRHEEATILFTDFSGFTQAVATIPAKRLVQELDEIFRGFDDIVAANGLEKIKTIGDAYMVASGLPVAAEDHAVRCVRAGLELARFIETRNQTAAMKWGLRVGVHSGAVVAGIVGKNKYAYDVWGDTVNIASRLESAGEANKVNISAYTFELVREHFECEYRGKLAAKGKGEIDMYFVLRERLRGASDNAKEGGVAGEGSESTFQSGTAAGG